MEINTDRTLAIVGIVLSIVLVVLDKTGKLKGPILFCLLAFAACMTIPLALNIPWVSSQSGNALFARRAFALAVVLVTYCTLAVWISGAAPDAEHTPQGRVITAPQPPSEPIRPDAAEKLDTQTFPHSSAEGHIGSRREGGTVPKEPEPQPAAAPSSNASSPAQQTVNAPGGIGSIGGTLINPQVNNFGYMQKRLTADQLAYISAVLKPLASAKDRSDLITCQLGDSNSCTVAVQLVKAFRAAGWNLSGSGYNQAVMTEAPEPLLIVIKGNSSMVAGRPITSAEGFPPGAYELANALRTSGINVAFALDANSPADEFRITVGTRP